MECCELQVVCCELNDLLPKFFSKLHLLELSYINVFALLSQNMCKIHIVYKANHIPHTTHNKQPDGAAWADLSLHHEP
jgi:hypothetical protein